jgi:hypothetical protein
MNKLYHRWKTLVFICIQDNWGRVNLKEKYGSIAEICIKLLNLNFQLQSRIKHCFQLPNSLKMMYITSNNTELSRHYSHIYTTKDVSKPGNSWNQNDKSILTLEGQQIHMVTLCTITLNRIKSSWKMHVRRFRGMA